MSAQRRQRETWEHKARADSCMEMSCSVRSGKCQACCAALYERELGHSRHVCEEW